MFSSIHFNQFPFILSVSMPRNGKGNYRILELAVSVDPNFVDNEERRHDFSPRDAADARA